MKLELDPQPIRLELAGELPLDDAGEQANRRRSNRPLRGSRAYRRAARGVCSGERLPEGLRPARARP